MTLYQVRNTQTGAVDFERKTLKGALDCTRGSRGKSVVRLMDAGEPELLVRESGDPRDWHDDALKAWGMTRRKDA